MSKLILLIASIIIISALVSGCSENEISQPQEEHFEAIGMYFTSSGIEVVSILRGVTDDTLKAPIGAIGDAIDVQFYDKNENVIDPPSNSEQTLAWEISDTTIVEVFQHAGEEGGYEFHLRGKAAGLTDIEFFLVHEGHNDFRSGKIPVKAE